MDTKIICLGVRTAVRFATLGVHHQRGGVDAVSVVAFAYDSYTNPSKNNGVLGAKLTEQLLPLRPTGDEIFSKFRYALLGLWRK